MTTPVPEEGLHGDISQSYGTFNTLQTQAGISGNNNKLFWGINGTYRTSDGYITTPADEVDEYTEESFLDEQTINGRFGYFVTPDQTIEIAGGYYSGSGVQVQILQDMALKMKNWHLRTAATIIIKT